MNKIKKLIMLNLARESIKSKLENKALIISEDIKQSLRDKKSCFVTLTIKNDLRGCIGSLIPNKELWKEIVDNSISAAFNDFRFNPLTKEEFKELKIEISIISKIKEINYKNFEELKKKIKNKGVLINYKNFSATYLPQVWEEIRNEEYFLSSLCMKAGLDNKFWRNGKLKFFIYDVESIKE